MKTGPTTGTILKSKLGLDKLKYVVIVRALSISYRTYLVVFNTRLPNLPITQTMVYRGNMPSMIYTAPFTRRPSLGPIQNINDFNGTLDGSLFFVIDLAGYLGDSSQRTRVIEKVSYAKTLKNLIEGLTIPEIRSGAVSKRNKDWLRKRRQDGSTGSFLKEVNWVENEDSIYLVYHSKPTYETTVTNYSPSGNSYPDNHYIVQIQFLGVSRYLGSKDQFKLLSPKEQGDLILKMIDTAEVKLWSSDPSWIFQGSFEAFEKEDASIYPLWSPRGSGIWDSKHGLSPHITKHTVEVLETVKPNYQDIAIELRTND